MCLTEYDEEEFKRVCREDGYTDGLAEGELKGAQQKTLEVAINLLKMKKLSPEEIAQVQGLPLKKVLKLKKSITE